MKHYIVKHQKDKSSCICLCIYSHLITQCVHHYDGLFQEVRKEKRMVMMRKMKKMKVTRRTGPQRMIVMRRDLMTLFVLLVVIKRSLTLLLK